MFQIQDLVYVYPGRGLGHAELLDGLAARVTAKTGEDRYAVRLLNGDPRPIYCRKPDGVLYLNGEELSHEQKSAAEPLKVDVESDGVNPAIYRVPEGVTVTLFDWSDNARTITLEGPFNGELPDGEEEEE